MSHDDRAQSTVRLRCGGFGLHRDAAPTCPPSELFRRNISGCFIEDEAGVFAEVPDDEVAQKSLSDLFAAD